MKLDAELCVGHGRCLMVASEVYDEDERSYCVLRFERVPEGLEQKAREGAEACPEQALTIEDD